MFKLKLKRRETKKKRPSRDGGGLKSVLVRTVPAALAVSVTVALFVILFISLVNLRCFRLRAIEARGAEGIPSIGAALDGYLKENAGRNIFMVDIGGIAAQVSRKYPDIKEATVRRKLPDTLSMSVVVRRPVALLSSDRYYPVDYEGVILPHSSASFWKKLPLVTGVALKDQDKAGRRCESRPLRVALELISEINSSKALSDYTITSIDVSDPGNVSFYLEDGLEVRIGHGSFKERLGSLAGALKNPKLVLSRIKYIDLRFKDIYIGPK